MVSNRISEPIPTKVDLFCQVIDNFGDAGVCWRLARQLAGEYGYRVRLWIDKPSVLRRICPLIQTSQAKQVIGGIDIRHWSSPFSRLAADDVPDVVIEGFGAHLPESYVRQMAQKTPAPVWINLEYLSAEKWIDSSHLMASPQSWVSLTKYFYFPGFSPKSGGLIREKDLFAERDVFQTDPSAVQRFLSSVGVAREADVLLVSLFCYPAAPVASLLDYFAKGDREVVCLVPEGVATDSVQSFIRCPPIVGTRCREGRLTLQIIPMLPQPDYDRLLWSCDLNFVRGEDSFVRAQWAARPFVWHIYPQQEEAHRIKMDAFLERYLATMSEEHAAILRAFWYDWNGMSDQRMLRENGAKFTGMLSQLKQYGGDWAKKMALFPDLASGLVRFINTLR